MNAPAQRTDAWFAARVSRITGSRAGAILGLNPYQSRDDVMREMVREYFNAEKEFTGNVATEWGTEHEAEALAEFEAWTGEMVDEAGLIVHPEHDWLAASPDGLIGDAEGLEIKCPYSGNLKMIDEQPHYLAQIQLCLAVTGRERWHYFAWTPNEQVHEIVKRDPSWLDDNLPAFQAFMADYWAIIEDEAKAAEYLNDKELDLSADSSWQTAAEVYLQAKQAADNAEKDLKAAKAKLTKIAQATGAQKVVGLGVQAYQCKRAGAVDYAKVPELEGVDLEQYRKKPTTYWSVR